MPAYFRVARGKSPRHHSVGPLRNHHLSPGPPKPVRGLFYGGRHLWLMCGVFVMATLVTGAVVIWQLRQSTFTSSQRELSNLGIVLAEQTSRMVQSVDLVLREVQSRSDELEPHSPEQFRAESTGDPAHQFLVSRGRNLPQARMIVVIGATGDLLNWSEDGPVPNVSFSDRDYFHHLRVHDDPGVFISDATMGRLTGKWVIFIVRRVNGPDGTFLGLVAGLIDTRYLEDFYSTISMVPGESVTLLRRDGVLIAGHPDIADRRGMRLAEQSPWYERVIKGGGSYRSPGYLAGIPQLITVHPLRDYPLVVDANVSVQAILENWYKMAVAIAMAVMGAAGGLIVLFAIVIAQFRNQKDQNVRLAESAASLRAGERRLKSYAEMAADWFWEQDANLCFVRDARIPLTSPPTDVGRSRWELSDPTMDQDRWDSHKACLAARRPFRDFRWERIGIDGERHHMSTSGDPMFDETGAFLGYHGTGRDITAEVAAKNRAEQAETLLRDAVNSMSEGFVIYDRDDRFLMCNDTYLESYRKLYPEGADSLVAGARLEDIYHHILANGGGGDAARGREAEWLDERLRLRRQNSGAYEQRMNDGSWYLVTNRRMKNGGVAGLRIDITERKRSEDRIAHLAHHDALTGLPNRTLLNDRLSQALHINAREGGGLAVLALDLNRFKAVNDGFGHAAGDGLLKLVADRLRGALRASDTLARVGGDEFVVVLTDVDRVVAGGLAQRLIESLAEPFQMNDLRVRIGSSIGIALCPRDGDSADALLKNADTALYRAKIERESRFRFFEPNMDLRLRERWTMERDLRLAIGTDELRLHYQPTFSSTTRSIVGFEALLRWHHPVRGNIPPMSFIPVAEENGMIVTIGTWVLEEACRTAMAWSSPKRIAVNLSAAQLGSGELPTQVTDILRRTGLPPGRLELEVTETMLISDHCQVLDTLRELRDMGVQIACDDFGTGYSSFSYIQNLAFDRIKIDQSFVRALGVSPTAPRIVQAILALARSLDMEVTAEGVESEQQFAMLRELGCDEIQGFLLGEPMPPEAIPETLRTTVTAGNAVRRFPL
jgi:diguanylate cyclase (GGDEF)-like protein